MTHCRIRSLIPFSGTNLKMLFWKFKSINIIKVLQMDKDIYLIYYRCIESITSLDTKIENYRISSVAP